jgi:histidine triad (HIT) family protein
MNSCIFCKIAQKKVPASHVYEDEQVLAFLDIRPLNQGHTLIIPKKHYENIFEIPIKLNSYLHGIAKQVALAVRKTVEADGISIIQQNGEAADQEIPHLHVHIIPRFKRQKMPSFTKTTEEEKEKLDEIATRIRKNLQINSY